MKSGWLHSSRTCLSHRLKPFFKCLAVHRLSQLYWCLSILLEIKIHKSHSTMEDGVTEAESLVPPLNHSSEDGSKKEDEKEEKKEGFVFCTEKVEAKDSSSGGGGGGLINNLISTLITPLSPRTGKATTEYESGNEVFESEKGTVADGGGNNGEKGGVDNGEDKGLISNLVSNFFHRSESEEGVVETEEKEKEEEETLGDEKIKRLLKTENEGNSGGGGIIDDIVSHLPASLPDDVAPTADEATILINSLVRD